MGNLKNQLKRYLRHSHTPSLVHSSSMYSAHTHSRLGSAGREEIAEITKMKTLQAKIAPTHLSPRVSINCLRPSYAVHEKGLVHTHREEGCSLLSPGSLQRSIPKPIASLLPNNRAPPAMQHFKLQFKINWKMQTLSFLPSKISQSNRKGKQESNSL